MKRIKKTYKSILIYLVIMCINLILFSFIDINITKDITLSIDVQSNSENKIQIFYGDNDNWVEENSSINYYEDVNTITSLNFKVPHDVERLRIDVGENETRVEISNILIKQYVTKTSLDIEESNIDFDASHNIKDIKFESDKLIIDTNDNDPYFVIQLDSIQLNEIQNNNDKIINAIKLVIILIVSFIMLIIINNARKIMSLIKGVFNQKAVIWNLSKNDFKTKYAGSYLGITWAFVQPIITVLLYWFVFQIGFKSTPMDNFPFVLWLIAGIVPWFYFQEALSNATTCLLEYSYLVKKVVFNISILPIVKVTSSLFVHIFFILFTIVLFSLYGYYPTIYFIQLLYYVFCTVILVLSISYMTSAIIVFFKDLGQIINILLQIGLWMTPILWNLSMMPKELQWVIQINPIYYIVEGYRDSFINNVWFFEKLNETIYFWTLIAIIFTLGIYVFKKLKIHFADVL